MYNYNKLFRITSDEDIADTTYLYCTENYTVIINVYPCGKIIGSAVVPFDLKTTVEGGNTEVKDISTVNERVRAEFHWKELQLRPIHQNQQGYFEDLEFLNWRWGIGETDNHHSESPTPPNTPTKIKIEGKFNSCES